MMNSYVHLTGLKCPINIRSLCTFIITNLLFIPFVLSEVKKDDVDTIYDLSLEELLDIKISTVSKTSQAISRAPGIVSVITAEQIKQNGYQSLVELMPLIPGFSVQNTYFQNDIVTARGVMMTLYNDKILMLLNGVPATNAATMEYYLNSVPVGAIERLEIVRGPGSTLYGTNAFSGVINVITYKNWKQENNNVKVQAGSFGNRTLSASYGVTKDDQSWYITATVRDDDGYHKSLTDELGTSGTVEYENDINNFFASYNHQSISIVAGYSKITQSTIGSAPMFIFGNNGILGNGRDEKERAFIDVGYSWNLTEDTSIKYSIHYNNYERWIEGGLFALTVFEPLGIIPQGIADNRSRALFSSDTLWSEVQLSYHINDKFNLITGLNYEKRSVDELLTFFNSDRETNLSDLFTHTSNSQNDFRDNAAYMQLHGEITRNLNYNLAVRYTELDSTDDSYVTPRAGLVYAFSDKSTIKLLYGEGFRSASPLEINYNVPALIFGASIAGRNLEPEISKSVELAWDRQFEASYLRMNYYLLEISNVINRRVLNDEEIAIIGPPAQFGNPLTYDNLGSSEFSGIEIEYQHYFSNAFNAFANASFKNSESNASGRSLNYIEDYTFNLGLSYQKEKSRITAVYQHVSGKSGVLSDDTPNSISSYGLLNLSYFYQFNESMEFGLKISNALDKEYEYPEYVRRNLRSIPGGAERAIYGEFIYSF